MRECAVVAQVTDLVRELGKVPATVFLGADSRFVEDLGIDSLDLVAVFLGVQDRFGVVVEDDDVSALRTVGDLAAYVNRGRDARAA
jgi:acyl carrier protein